MFKTHFAIKAEQLWQGKGGYNKCLKCKQAVTYLDGQIEREPFVCSLVSSTERIEAREASVFCEYSSTKLVSQNSPEGTSYLSQGKTDNICEDTTGKQSDCDISPDYNIKYQ